jgi:hypothetical protein
MFPKPSNQCWPEPVPFIFKHMGLLMLQQPHQITMIFNGNHEVRQVRPGGSPSAQVMPSWHGDAVGHFEDTSAIDTVSAVCHDRFVLGRPIPKSRTWSMVIDHLNNARLSERRQFCGVREKEH